MTCPSQVFDLALKSSDPTPARRPTAKQALQGIMAALQMNGAVYVCDEPQQVNEDLRSSFSLLAFALVSGATHHIFRIHISTMLRLSLVELITVGQCLPCCISLRYSAPSNILDLTRRAGKQLECQGQEKWTYASAKPGSWRSATSPLERAKHECC